MKKYGFFLLFAIALSFAACGDDNEGGGGDKPSSENVNRNTGKGASFVMTETSDAVNASGKFINRLEVPKLQNGDVFIVHQSTDMTGNPVNYCAAYVSTKQHSRWVAYRFDKAMSVITADGGRKPYDERPQYPQDPYYDVQPYDDASFAGYDHGHLCASYDRQCSRKSNDQTFYMTNMSPMMARFNQDYWPIYESYVQSLARDKKNVFADTLYVVKGGTIESGQTLGNINVAGEKMPQPKYYFIALLSYKSGGYSGIAFWIEHQEYPSISNKDSEISKHAISIDELEQKTGIDFFCNLPDKLENAVEKTLSRTSWRLPEITN